MKRRRSVTVLTIPLSGSISARRFITSSDRNGTGTAAPAASFAGKRPGPAGFVTPCSGSDKTDLILCSRYVLIGHSSEVANGRRETAGNRSALEPHAPGRRPARGGNPHPDTAVLRGQRAGRPCAA